MGHGIQWPGVCGPTGRDLFCWLSWLAPLSFAGLLFLWVCVPVGRSAKLISSFSFCGGVVTCALVRRRLCRWSCCEPRWSDSAQAGLTAAADKNLSSTCGVTLSTSFHCHTGRFTFLYHTWCLCPSCLRASLFGWRWSDSNVGYTPVESQTMCWWCSRPEKKRLEQSRQQRYVGRKQQMCQCGRV